MSTHISISPSAYSLIVLHSSKHPSNSILGLLIGTQSQSDKKIEITSVVPLLHHLSSLATMSQVASSLVQAHINNTNIKDDDGEKLQILGAYQANANKDDRQTNGATGALVGRIAQLNGTKDGLLLLLQSHLLLSPTTLALSPFLVSSATSSSTSLTNQNQDSSTTTTLPTQSFPSINSLPTSCLTLSGKEGSEIETETFIKSLDREIKAGKGLKVIDFDEHLEDTTLDWLTNKEVLSSIRV